MPRVIDDFEDKIFWEKWLDKKYGNKLKAIREQVKSLYKENKTKYGELPHFTPHNIEHCANVENLIHRLIPRDKYEKLTLKERFYLLAASWLHDIGMLKSVFINISPKLKSNPSTIRDYHHITTARFIVDNWSRLRIDERDKELLAKLCFYHRKQEDLSECEEYFFLGNVTYRLRLMAAYLRLADALDICSDRTPMESYAVCLAYNIPNESKLHWIKHRIISGVFLDEINHKIYIQFKVPQEIPAKYEDEDDLSVALAKEKTDSIIRLILNDLKSELYSLINVLVRGNITYYLDIIPKFSEVMLDNQMETDLREIIFNYDIMMAPSASKLLNMILIIIANILDFDLRKSKPKETYKDPGNKLKKIEEFLSIIKNDIISSRPCHLGLRKLVSDVDEKLATNDIKELIKLIDDRYQKHQRLRSEIRQNAMNFFTCKVLNSHNNQEGDNPKTAKVNILLYGYSELAVKAICGFRDALIDDNYPCIKDKHQEDSNKFSKKIYSSSLEESVSNDIRVFICDGQPKTQITESNYLYHDATQYALYLYERNFKNIIIIPDIIAGSILRCFDIDFLVVGANGITRKVFRHSGGHLGLIKLVKSLNETKQEEEKKTKIILVTTSEKIEINTTNEEEVESANDNDHKTKDVEGFQMYKLPIECGRNRDHLWLMNDMELMKRLSDTSILFANPREDKIEINDIDYIIIDNQYNNEKRWFTSDEWNNFIQNISSEQ